MIIKLCKQCGELKPDTNFRPYYGKRKGRYKTCMLCERVNNRYKYLTRKPENTITPDETTEVVKIEQLYGILRERGLQPPGNRQDSLPLDLDSELQKHQEELTRQQESSTPDNVPEVLQFWLTANLEGRDPEELQTVADKLLSEYRPLIKMNSDYTPVYDETYRDILNSIIRRFDDYEDETP